MSISYAVRALLCIIQMCEGLLCACMCARVQRDEVREEEVGGWGMEILSILSPRNLESLPRYYCFSLCFFLIFSRFTLMYARFLIELLILIESRLYLTAGLLKHIQSKMCFVEMCSCLLLEQP